MKQEKHWRAVKPGSPQLTTEPSLLPCDVLLLTVTDVETTTLLDMAEARTMSKAEPVIGKDRSYFNLGTFGGARVLTVRTEMGAGSVGGALTTTLTALNELHPASVIIVGIAFGVDPTKQAIGRVLVSKKIQPYELQRVGKSIELRADRPTASPKLLSRFRTAARNWPGRVDFGLILSGEKLIDKVDYRDKLLNLVPDALGGEMEAAGLYAAARESESQWILVKAICDWADGEKHKNKDSRQKQAAERAVDFVLHALELGGFSSRPTAGQSPSPTSRSGMSHSGTTPQKPKRFDPPRPHYPDKTTRDLSKSLKKAYRLQAELKAKGKDTTDVTETILDLRRRIREGGQLREGDFLLGGRFQLLEAIGRGGFAQVWKAYDERRHDVVAIKVLHGQHTRDESRCERFFRGARQMARIQYPGIVRVFEEKCEEGGYCFFVMEYVSGGDLRQAVKASCLSREERLRILLEVGDALTFAHERGLIHRDVKPGNILLDLENRPKLTDFDLVRAADTTGGTRTTGMGSLPYASPEAMMNASEADKPADVYGLGMTSIFTFHGADLPPIVQRDPEGFAASLEVSPICRQVLRRSVVFDPKSRWPTVESFCQALRDSLEDLGRWTDPILGAEFVYIDPGDFWMGSPESEAGRWDDEKRHRVKLTRGFWVCTTAVTRDQFAKFVEATGYETAAENAKEESTWRDSGGPDHPVAYVSWNDAEQFCTWLSGQVEGEIRLPTESEWEYAARAGTTTATYRPKLEDIAWYKENCEESTHPVGEMVPNEWGLFDMLGNVREWVADWHGEYPDSATDPTGPLQGSRRVLRGGSWYNPARFVRAAARGWFSPDRHNSDLGFRLVRDQVRGADAGSGS